MTPTEPGFYWAEWTAGSGPELVVVEVRIVSGRAWIWFPGSEMESNLDDWIFLSGPLPPPEPSSPDPRQRPDRVVDFGVPES